MLGPFQGRNTGSPFPFANAIWHRTLYMNNIFLLMTDPYDIVDGDELPIQASHTLLEKLPRYRLVIFSTTEILQDDLFGNFSSPFARRCKVFTFSNQALAADMAKRAREIAIDEGLDGKPEQAYLRLVQECKNNFGMVLQRIEQAEMLV